MRYCVETVVVNALLGSGSGFFSSAFLTFLGSGSGSSIAGGAYASDNEILSVNQLVVLELAVTNLDGLLYRPLTFTFFMLR